MLKITKKMKKSLLDVYSEQFGLNQPTPNTETDKQRLKTPRLVDWLAEEAIRRGCQGLGGASMALRRQP